MTEDRQADDVASRSNEGGPKTSATPIANRRCQNSPLKFCTIKNPEMELCSPFMVL